MSKNNLLLDFVSLSEGTEIPDTFALWCGLAGVSCSLGRRVWIDMGTFKIYPNLFIVLVAGSGQCRKSTAIGLIEKPLRKVRPSLNLISQKLTPEALIEAMRTAVMVDKKPVIKCTGFVVVDELSNFLNRKIYDQGMGALLISMFDCKDQFEYRTKGRGIERISKACLGILAGTTPKSLREALPKEAIGDGLVSRIIFVYVDKPKPPVAIPVFGSGKRDILEGLSTRLGDLGRFGGRVKWGEGAVEIFKEEYDRFFKTSAFQYDQNLQGYASRRNIHLLRIAMILSSVDTEGDRIIVEGRHVETASDILGTVEPLLPRIINLITSSERGALTELVYVQIKGREGGVERRNLVRSVSHRISSRELDEILLTLQESGKIKQVIDGKTRVYRAIERKER